MAISHLEDTSGRAHLALYGALPAPFPLQFEYPESLSSHDLEKNVSSDGAGPKLPTDAETVEALTTPSTVVENEGNHYEASHLNGHKADSHSFASRFGGHAEALSDGNDSPSRPTMFPLPGKRRVSQVNNNMNTQSSYNPEITEAIGAMMRTEHLTQGDTQDQSMEDLHLNSSQGMRPRRGRLESYSNTPMTKPPVKTAKPALPRSISKDLEISKSTLRQSAGKLAKAGKGKNKAHLILCQCGHLEEEGDMVRPFSPPMAYH